MEECLRHVSIDVLQFLERTLITPAVAVRFPVVSSSGVAPYVLIRSASSRQMPRSGLWL